MRLTFSFLLIALSIYGCTKYENESTKVPSSQFKDTEVRIAENEYLIALEQLEKFNYDSTLYHANQAIEILEDEDIPQIKGRIYLLLAHAHYFRSDYEEAKQFADLALQAAKTANSDSLKGHATHRVANIYRHTGKYKLATEWMYEAISIAEQTDDLFLLGKSYMDLGNVYDYDAEYEKAEEFYLLARDIFQELGDKAQLAGVLGNLGSMVYETADYERALSMHMESLQLLKEINYRPFLANTYNNIGVTYRELGMYDSTLKYIAKTMEMDIEDGYKKGIAMNYEMYGEIFLLLDDPKSAKDSLLLGIELAEEISIKGRLRTMYRRLFRADSALGNYQDALKWFGISYALRDSLYNEEKARSISELREEYEAEQREREISYLTERSEIIQTRNIIVGVALFSLISLITLLWIRERATQRKEIELLEKDKIITEKELEATRSESDYLKKELTNYALHLAQKNEFLNDLKSEMAEVRRKVENSEALKQINQVGSKIYQNTAILKEREEFQAHVDQVCEGFFQRMIERHPNLTEQEKRLSAMLRLNLSSKDIANIFNISPKSVDQGRYRLRKKLNLSKDIQLSDYLNRI